MRFPHRRSRSRLALLLGILGALAAALPVWAADPPDGMGLSVVSGPGAGQVTLTWTGGIDPFRVYRSATAGAITDAGSFLGETLSTVWVDTPPAGKVFFYRVVMCTAGADCASTFCADGWCCTTDCSLTCEACNLPASEGACTLVPLGTDPAEECPGAATCNGAGACSANQPNGSICVAFGDCASGFCVDGVCCESACGGTCEACNLASREGFCDPVPAGADPANECTATPASTCGTNGVCAGNRACQLYTAGTTCAAPACAVGGTQSNSADQCNGAGACVDGGVQNCAPFACNGTTGLCRTSCSSTADCGPGFGCKVSTGQCLALDGGSCVSGGNCFNGACCSNVCRNLTTDTNNCGFCGLACTNPHGTTGCVSGACSPSCTSGWGSCDANLSNGCERSLTTLTDCAACGVPCSLANASESCSTGACVIGTCNAGNANCDGVDSNGCEVSHAAVTGTCPTAENVGSLAGDTLCGFLCPGNGTWVPFATRNGQTSAWFRARANENSNCSTSIEHQVRLDVPPGVDFDLYVYLACGTPVGSSTGGIGVDEIVTVSQDDTAADDSFNYWIEVRWFGGASCTPWTLQFFGHFC